jgi:hypothetical protein
MIDVIRNPLITKKISTPINPPENKVKSKWYNITGIIDNALSPSTCALYFKNKPLVKF